MIALKLILEGLGLGFLLYLSCAIGIRNGATEFVREYTLASGGPYCDCGYKKLNHT